MEGFAVEVFATSWIEMSIGMEVPPRDAVEVFATSWIEILNISQSYLPDESRSLRPRGLK